ncbi:unnamed protein product [Acanthosepion pharaonis]|uniref:Uncharacterized protein n=1 Tax=Acanthosepion pharaonis TaxID=158019 RepID=A0A812CQC2_ACAPH|nr:unnamed protein product [Sepia pharaonis]
MLRDLSHYAFLFPSLSVYRHLLAIEFPVKFLIFSIRFSFTHFPFSFDFFSCSSASTFFFAAILLLLLLLSFFPLLLLLLFFPPSCTAFFFFFFAFFSCAAAFHFYFNLWEDALKNTPACLPTITRRNVYFSFIFVPFFINSDFLLSTLLFFSFFLIFFLSLFFLP